MASAEDVRAELMGENAPANHHDVVVFKGMPGLTAKIRTVQAKVTYAVDEVTKGLPRRALSELRRHWGGRNDTTLGHAIDAASASHLGLEVSLRIVKALEAKGFDVDLTGIIGLDAE